MLLKCQVLQRKTEGSQRQVPASLVEFSVDYGLCVTRNSKPYARLSLSPSDWVLRAVSFDLTPALKVWVGDLPHELEESRVDDFSWVQT